MAVSDELVNAKRALRANIRERRNTLPAHTRELATTSLTANLQQLVAGSKARSLACYLATPTEPETRPFLAWAYEAGIRVLLPVSREDGLLDWAVANNTPDENVGLHGMPEPTGELLGPIAINDVDLIIVPAAAVDRRGMRMGWGMGYYDKTLGSMERRPPVYALVYDEEVVDELPREIHDQPVTGVVTPAGITTF